MMVDLNSYDWREVFAYAGDLEDDPNGAPNVSQCIGSEASVAPVLRGDVKRVLAFSDGQNDELDWLIVVELNDGRFAFICAGCDYTGWDCQAQGYCVVDTDLEHLKLFGIPQSDVVRLGI